MALAEALLRVPDDVTALILVKRQLAAGDWPGASAAAPSTKMLLVPQACDAPLTDLARRMRPALVSYFLRRVRDPSEAEDLAHEVFIRLAGTRLD